MDFPRIFVGCLLDPLWIFIGFAIVAKLQVKAGFSMDPKFSSDVRWMLIGFALDVHWIWDFHRILDFHRIFISISSAFVRFSKFH